MAIAETRTFAPAEGSTLETKLTGKIRVNADALTELVAAFFRHNNMPADDAMVSAKGIVLADLVGHESHGVSNNLAGFYLPDLESGVINPRPNIRITRESPVDGDVGGRPRDGLRRRDPGDGGRDRAGAKVGSGWAAVGNSRHYGMAQIYSRMALDHDQIGLLDDQRRHAGRRAVRRPRAEAQHEPDLGRGPGRRGAAVRARHGDHDGGLRQDRQLPARGQADPADVGPRPRRPPDDRPGRGEGRRQAADVRRHAGGRGAQGLRPGRLGRHHVRRPVGLGLHRQAGRRGERQPLLRRLERRQLRADRAPQGAHGRAPARPASRPRRSRASRGSWSPASPSGRTCRTARPTASRSTPRSSRCSRATRRSTASPTT